MALPKLNEVPKYELNIPSTNQKVRFRPFLMKEEKILLMAMESQNQTDIFNTIIDTLSACIEDDIDINKFGTFDVEYCFLKIRSKSAGEKADMVFQCTECGSENEVSINIDDIKIEVPKLESIIEINNDVSVEMTWPSFNDVAKNDTIINSESTVDQVFALVRACMVSINTKEERFAIKDHSKEEIDQFIESLNSDQFGKIREYVEQMPRLKHDVSFCCTNCASANEVTVEGLQSFFS